MMEETHSTVTPGIMRSMPCEVAGPSGRVSVPSRPVLGGRAVSGRVHRHGPRQRPSSALPPWVDPSTWTAPPELASLLRSEVLKDSPPHFGASAAVNALGGAGAAAGRLAGQLPPVPTELEAAHSEATAGLSAAWGQVEGGVSAVAAWGPLQAVAQFADAVATSASAAQAQGAAALSALAASLAAAAASGGVAGDIVNGDVEAHFGSLATDAALENALTWLRTRTAFTLPALDLPEASAAMDELRQALAQLATMPAAVVGPVLKPLLDALAALVNPAALPGAVAAASAELEASLLALQAGDLSAAIGGGVYNLAAVLLAVSGALALVVVTAPTTEDAERSMLYEAPLSYEYSPEVLEQYFRRRPVAVAQRAVRVAAAAASFGASLLMDQWTGRIKANEQARALQLRVLIERLGPTYVKVAQAVSTRVDLLSSAYFLQIQLLQDRVPPFPSEEARVVMTKTFGRKPETVFATMSAAPVAAASLGQVYRATLLPEFGGGEVAVKVQRPGVLGQVALDLFLIRQLTLAVPVLADDWPAIIDNWAVRFFHEMDYGREANNAATFKRQMAELEGILVPAVRADLSSVEVLTTEWVDGEKLSDSRASDVRELCNTLLNAFLIQLLDTGFLHADPHPGNLIRTFDGKLAILDYGLMTEISGEQRIALVEYIAHLSTEDWAGVAKDLKTLGFIPDSVSELSMVALERPLGNILQQLVGGGGAAKVNIDKITVELETLAKIYPFQIPPFFALVLRAFSVIEGIALTVDPDYAIVRECFPYLSRRLLSDDSPRARKALRDVLYGSGQRLNIDRLMRLANGINNYTTDGQLQVVPQEVDPVTGEPRQSPLLDDTLVDVLQIVFSKRGSYVQELLVEEAVAAADALSREALSEVVRMLLGSLPAMAAAGLVESLGPLRPILLPLPTPLEFLARLAPAVAVTAEDREALVVVRGMVGLAQQLSPPPSTTAPYGGASTRSNPSLQRIAAEAGPLWEKLGPGLTYTGEMFMRAFTQRVAARFVAGMSLTSEYQMAMTALNMMPGASSILGGSSLLGGPLAGRSSTSSGMVKGPSIDADRPRF